MKIRCTQVGCPGHDAGPGVPGLLSTRDCLTAAVADLTLSNGFATGEWDIPPAALHGTEIDLFGESCWQVAISTMSTRRLRTRLIDVHIPAGNYAFTYRDGVAEMIHTPLSA